MDDEERLEATDLWSSKQGDGYPAFATFVAQDYDDETYVFRRFRNLAARTLLHLQGELIKLEKDSIDLDNEAALSKDPDLHQSMTCWATCHRNAQDPNQSHERKRQELAEVIEVKLKKYCESMQSRRFVARADHTADETLMLHRQVSVLEPPSPRVLAALRLWLHGPSQSPNETSKLDGRDRFVFSDKDDLVALRPPPERDILSRKLRDHWPLPSKVQINGTL